jgi:phosphoserine phosphatase RsbU/P
MLFKVLIVDDEADLELLIRQKFRKKIKDGELEFVFARHGEEALGALREDPALDIVITDINMPVMDGLTLLSRLSDINRILKTVIVSAYGDMPNIRMAMNRGAYDFLTKPLDFHDFELTLNKTIHEVETIKEGVRAREQLNALQIELSIASRIQQSILPRQFPPFPLRTDFEIYAKMTPANSVGGDFYDFFLIDNDRLGFVIGDVSGKGVPAAIFMAVCRTLLKATALQGASAADCVRYVNGVLFRQSEPEVFVTIFYGILHTGTGELEFCRAGHNAPYVLSLSQAPRLLDEPSGTIAGAFEQATFESGRTKLVRGDCLFLFTDGVTESVNSAGDVFSDERLRALLEQTPISSAEEPVGDVVRHVRNFSGNAPPADDVTVMAVRYIGRE